MPKTVFSLRVSNTIVQELDKVCEKMGLQRNDLIVMILADWVKNKRALDVF
ncbi:MAG: hypothetical protein HYU39_01550 [Thaumarchaeota archaeon]|nr:hypothetical protein [Nitrososphaerota archaeon]